MSPAPYEITLLETHRNVSHGYVEATTKEQTLEKVLEFLEDESNEGMRVIIKIPVEGGA
jgi:hypothetical protein